MSIEVSYSQCKQKQMSFGEQASWAKMTSPRGKLTVPTFNLAITVNKSEELTYTSISIWVNLSVSRLNCYWI